MSYEWSGVIKTTMPKYLKQVEDNTMRGRRWLKEIKSRGRIMYNKRGSSTIWKVQYKEPPVEDYADGGVLDYARQDLWLEANIDWRGYVSKDAMTLKESLINGAGDTQIIDRYKRIIPQLTQSITNKLGLEVYIDGYATGNQNRLHGIESFMAARTSPGAANKIAEPSDTYGGLSTALGNYGGTWSDTMATPPNSVLSNDYPYGTGDTQYDFWSPKLVNYVGTDWGGGATWALNCERVLRETSTWCRLLNGAGIDEYMLGQDLYTGYLNVQGSKQRILVGTSNGGELGFDSSYTQEGVKLSTEYGIAPSIGYGLNYGAMEMLCLDSQLIGSEGPDYSPHTPGWLFLVYFFGNMRFNPKGFAKIAGSW